MLVIQDSVSSGNTPRIVRRIMEVCDALPIGEGITTYQLADRLGVTKHYLSHHTGRSELDPYMIRGYRYSRKGLPTISGNIFVNPETKRQEEEGTG